MKDFLESFADFIMRKLMDDKVREWSAKVLKLVKVNYMQLTIPCHMVYPAGGVMCFVLC